MELAINQYGETFTPPADAAAWLVRRMADTKHGGPLPTFGADGRPLTLPVAATMADFQAALRKLGAAPGKYRLDALDRTGQRIEGGGCAYLLYPPGDEPRNGNTAGLRNAPPSVQGWAPAPAGTPWSSSPAIQSAAMWSTGGAFPLPTPAVMSGEQYLIGEVLRSQAAIMETMARTHVQMQAVNAHAQAQIGEVLTAAAELVRAADGASLTKRKPGVALVPPAPQVIVQPVAQPIYEAAPTDDRDDREVAAPPPAPASAMPAWFAGAFDMLAPLIGPIVQAKIGELLGGGFAAVAPQAPVMPRNAAPVIDVEPGPAVEQAPEAPEAPEVEPAPAVDIMPAAWSHLGAVARYLGPDGKRRLDAVLRTLSREEQSGLARDLVAMPLAAAAERVIAWVSVRELRAARARAAAAPTAATVSESTPAAPTAASAPMPVFGPAVLDSMRASVAAAMAAAGDARTPVDGDAVTGEASAPDRASAPTAAAGSDAALGQGADAATAAPGAAVVELYNTLAAEDNAVGAFLRAHPAGAVLVQAATQFMEPEALHELDRAITGAEVPAEFAAAVGIPFAASATSPAAPTAARAPTTATATAPTPSAPTPTPTPTPTPAVKVPLGAAMARMQEVLPHLSPEERTLAQSLALKMPPAQRDSMLATLVAVPVPEAVKLVREVVAEYVKHGRPFDR